MKAVSIQAFGDPGGLAVIDIPVPAPGRGQVLVATEAIGVGGVDVLIRSGALAARGFRKGFIPGSEVAGTVTAVGDGVDEAWAGRRVWAFTGSGGYAGQAVVPSKKPSPSPANLSSVDSVALGTSGVVAYSGLAHAHFTPGESVLVRGAAGSIGTMTVQLAVRGGVGAVAVTTSSAERGERLRELGATHVLDRQGDGDGPAGYDVIIDVVAGADLPSFLDLLNPNGRMVAVGAIGGQPSADFGTKLISAFKKSLSFGTFSADTVPAPDRRAVQADQVTTASRGELSTVVHEALPLEKAALAHRKMDAGEVFGRIVLTP
ncbi:zinc-binding dehydrogenase [Amycolatopsis sp. CA-230715]|uniref:zinc-binding dehydrogenase n=1 Tax=Amycolatopsis sp. CA-230715 TaxID=2745196 RepID=UPI001C02AD04|nr:zinc-binding dehydrogenase [Amycolatopsis sp. CA-230715]